MLGTRCIYGKRDYEVHERDLIVHVHGRCKVLDRFASGSTTAVLLPAAVSPKGQQYEAGVTHWSRVRIRSSCAYCTGRVHCAQGKLSPRWRPNRSSFLWNCVSGQNASKPVAMESDRELDLEELQDRFFSGKLSAAVREKLPDDLCELSELTEETLLNNLQRRFADGMIYTYVGSILVSVNPFRYLPIYNPKFGELYQGRQLGDSSLRPHVFAVADDAFNSMVRAKQRQCIVISGESGSGKTEATKLLLHHVMQGCAKVPTSEELRRILGTGPVLEVSPYMYLSVPCFSSCQVYLIHNVL